MCGLLQPGEFLRRDERHFRIAPPGDDHRLPILNDTAHQAGQARSCIRICGLNRHRYHLRPWGHWTASARLYEPKEVGLAADHPYGMPADDHVQVLVPDIKGRRRTSAVIRV
jgi:hypothetical protein